MTKEDEYELNVFQHKCFRNILKVYWPTKVSNEEIRTSSGIKTPKVVRGIYTIAEINELSSTVKPQYSVIHFNTRS